MTGKTLAFSSRNLKELIRDPLSYVFCLGFPIAMLVVMTLVNDGIPAEANMTIFRINNLAGGIAVFGLTFVMLFVCLSVSKDRSGAFLMRLYSTPMKSENFIAGYMLPSMMLAVLQVIITFAASLVIALIKGVELNVGGLLLSVVTLLPTIVMFISLGLLFGTLFSEKAAPGLCSVVISFASFLGGIWFDVDNTGGVLANICGTLPFVHAVKAARLTCALKLSELPEHLLITSGYAAVITVLAIVVFKRKMKADLG
ncbi:MAG: ABC transporter permease [Oscillospiraceae bacterium]|nr:ABC transporter permease [Oscillospiraceae bacterium]